MKKRDSGTGVLIGQPTHITEDSSFCIDLILAANPSSTSTSGVEQLLLRNAITF